MNLDLILPVGPGNPVELKAEIAGELTAVDLERHANRAPVQSALKRLTGRHQAMARALAGGAPDHETAALFGVSPGTVARLKTDPAFRNLMDFYRRSEDEIFFSTQERLASVTNAAIDALEDRLSDEETRAKITVPQLLEIVKTGADRTGNGPQTSSVQVNINTNLADRMKAARERANEVMRDITPKVAAE